MAKQTSTGVIIRISQGRPATLDQAGYEAKTYTEISHVTNIPTLGPTIDEVDSQPLATGVTEGFVGFVNYGSTTITAEQDDDDVGQQLADAACDKGNPSYGEEFTYEMEYASGSKRYWVGRFFSATETVGSANQMISSDYLVRVNTPWLKVPAP